MKLQKTDRIKLHTKLHQQVKDYLASAESIDSIFLIGEKQSLQSDQILILNEEIILVLYGLNSTSNLEKNLLLSLKIDPSKAKVLAKEIQENIISKLEKYIQKNTPPVDIEVLRKQRLNVEIELKNHISETPESTQKFITSGDLKRTIDELGIKYDLRPSKVIDLRNEILFVLVELLERGDFEKNLVENLGLPKEMTIKLAKEIDALIFSKLEKELTPVKPQEEGGTSKGEIPPNLPTATKDQKMPVFSKPVNVPIKSSEPIENEPAPAKPQENTPSQPKPENSFLRRQEEVPRGLSQQDVLEAKTQRNSSLGGGLGAGKTVPSTRNFPSYRDEKIGGVNIEKRAEDEIEENINRDDLLRDIENPTQNKNSSEIPQKSNYKGTDPYREPIE